MKLCRPALIFVAGLLVVAAIEGADTTVRAVESGEVPTFAGNAQHTGVFLPAAQPLNAIRWSATIDRRQTFTNTHYGSPLVTADNTVVVPVKTENDGFELHFLDGATGKRRAQTLTTDYVLPSHNWIPVFQPVVAKNRVYFAGAGGTLFYVPMPNLWNRAPVRVAFYGLDAFDRDKTSYTSSVFVNTPITADAAGNVYFGFRVQGTAPSPLSTTQSGFARIAPDGTGKYVLAGTAAADVAITRNTHNSAPALSQDEGTVYVPVKSGTTNAYAYLLGLDTTTLQTKFKVFLKDPRNGAINNASVSDDSTASPMVAPDGDVYFGVLANPNNGSRGFLLRFSRDLKTEKTPGSFGWDSTPAIVPNTMLNPTADPTGYMIFTKYNNYRFGDGDGVNRIALLFPAQTQVDPHPSANGLLVMREVMTVIGPTPDAPSVSPSFPFAVREWCINTAAVNPATRSIFVPNEDGWLYRWDLATNSLSQAVHLTQGFGEPYVPTIIGPDGTVFTLNGGTVFAVGASVPPVTMTSSKPDITSVVAGDSVILTVNMKTNWMTRLLVGGQVTLSDAFIPFGTTSMTSSDLARSPLSGGQATFSIGSLSAGTHFFTATHDRTGVSTTLVQKVHAYPVNLQLQVISRQIGTLNAATLLVTATGPAGIPTGVVTLRRDPQDLALGHEWLDSSGHATLTAPNLAVNNLLYASYGSDSVYAAGRGCFDYGAEPVPTPCSVVPVQQIPQAAENRTFFTSPAHQARHR